MIQNNVKKISFGFIVLFLIVLALGYKGTTSGNLKIGAVLPLTGFGSYWGQPVQKGIQLAQLDISSEFGGRVSVIIEDGKSDATVSATAASKLIHVDKVEALYTEFSGASSAISPIAKQAGKPFVYSTFNQKIAEDNDLSVKTFISYDVVCDTFAKNIEKNSKILIISSIADAAPYCVKGLERNINIENIKIIEGFKGTDFRTLLLQNKDFGADFILPIMYEDGSYSLLKQKSELGIQGVVFCYKPDCLSSKVVTGLPSSTTKGTMYFEVGLNQGFVDRIKSKYPEMTEGDVAAAANSYQSIMLAAEALHACGGGAGSCVVNRVADKDSLKYPGYLDAYIKNRILGSNIHIGVLK